MSNSERAYTEADKKSFAEMKKAELSSAYKLVDNTLEKIFTNEDNSKLIKLLDIYSKFSHLGITNSILIYAQYPTAKEVQTTNYWNEHNFYAKKGQRGFALITKGKQYTKADGSQAYARNLTKYFDVTQTTAPIHVEEPIVYPQRTILKALLRSCPITYELFDNSDSEVMAKYIPNDRKIVIQKDLSFEDFIKSFSTALAMSMLDRGKDFINNERLYLFEATSVSYLLCKKYNIDTSVFDFEKIPSEYMSFDNTKIKKSLYEIVDVNKNLQEKMYRNIQVTLKELQNEVDKQDNREEYLNATR